MHKQSIWDAHVETVVKDGNSAAMVCTGNEITHANHVPQFNIDFLQVQTLSEAAASTNSNYHQETQVNVLYQFNPISLYE